MAFGLPLAFAGFGGRCARSLPANFQQMALCGALSYGIIVTISAAVPLFCVRGVHQRIYNNEEGFSHEAFNTFRF